MQTTSDKSKVSGLSKKMISFVVAGLVIAVLIIAGLSFYFTSPQDIRHPEIAHHHFRMQLLIDGKLVDMTTSAFQEPYDGTICNNGLTPTPIHMHDGNGQVVHIHWAKIRGGDVLKYYGFNRIGGPNGSLGYRFDQGFPKSVPIHGEAIPESDKTMYVYQIKDGQTVERTNKDFLYDDIETFFGVKSSLTLQKEEAQQNSTLSLPSIKAYAQTSDSASSTPRTQEELKKLNDVLGDVVIFVQNDKPSLEDVQNRISQFVDLEDSQCGG